jgi:hypothetical protein
MFRMSDSGDGMLPMGAAMMRVRTTSSGKHVSIAVMPGHSRRWTLPLVQAQHLRTPNAADPTANATTAQVAKGLGRETPTCQCAGAKAAHAPQVLTAAVQLHQLPVGVIGRKVDRLQSRHYSAKRGSSMAAIASTSSQRCCHQQANSGKY